MFRRIRYGYKSLKYFTQEYIYVLSSWECKYQFHKLNETKKYKSAISISKDMFHIIKPILTGNDLLVQTI